MVNKHIFLTGSEGQLGLAISKKLNSEGCNVYGMDMNNSSKNKYLYKYKKGTVTDRVSFREFYNLIEIKEDPCKILLINNAGVSIFTPSEERTLEEFRFVTEVNMLGPIFGMTEFSLFINRLNNLKQNQNNNNFSIINISSIYGIVSPNMSIYTDTKRNNSEIYGASKAGLIQMTKYFATRYANIPININSIAPGGVINRDVQGEDFISKYSSLVPMKRLCKEEEIAEAVYMLFNTSNNYLTGQTIAVDGGLTSW